MEVAALLQKSGGKARSCCTARARVDVTASITRGAPCNVHMQQLWMALSLESIAIVPGSMSASRAEHMLTQRCSASQVRGPDGDLVDYELFTVKTMEDVLLREWEIDPTDVRLLEKIGEGEFGQVFRVRIPHIPFFAASMRDPTRSMKP